jgi:hypothetical protein
LFWWGKEEQVANRAKLTSTEECPYGLWQALSWVLLEAQINLTCSLTLGSSQPLGLHTRGAEKSECRVHGAYTWSCP